MTELPKGWEWASLDEIRSANAPIIYGILQPGHDVDGGVRYVRPTEIVNDRIDIPNLRRTTPEIANRYKRAALLTNDIVFSIVGSIGKIAIVPPELIGANITQSSARIRPDGMIVEPLYLKRAMKSPLFIEQCNGYQLGSAVPRLNLEDVRKLRIPLAPLNEQRRVVVKLEKLLSRVDAAQARLAAIPRILKRFRQSVLAAACSGGLTADWRAQASGVETSQTLIGRTRKARELRQDENRKTALANGQTKPLLVDNLNPLLRSDLDLLELPNSWEWVDLRFLMDEREAFCYGVVQPGSDSANGVRLIRICDLANGSVAMGRLRSISPAVHERYARSTVKGGEVLVSVVGTIGRVAIVPKECAGFNIARAIAKIPIIEFEPKYVRLWLTTTTAEQWMIGDAREVVRKTLNLEQLRTLPIPLPPTLEQQEIVRRVEALFKTADALEARYRKAKTHVDKLTQSILARAFRGELVPQDPNDEPASALLEHILAAKGGHAMTKERKRRGR